uniref:Ig-like domain-containing protein n=1 Tax=Fundulus heteroclitus TaxID=8078 RepID=A0A3Q2QL82_FUNHE
GHRVFLYIQNKLFEQYQNVIIQKPVYFFSQKVKKKNPKPTEYLFSFFLGETLRLITTLMKGTTESVLEQGFSPSQFTANYTTFKNEWSGMYLSLKGRDNYSNNVLILLSLPNIIDSKTGAMNYTVVQSPTISDPVQPGESVNLQCSVLSGSQMGSCPSEDRVLWFGVRKDTILGSIIYTDGNTPYECDTKSDMSSNSKRCVYHLLKNVSSSDSGIYYCALAMCGEIIFGNGTKLEVEGKWMIVKKIKSTFSIPALLILPVCV